MTAKKPRAPKVRWTLEREKYLRENYLKIPASEIAAAINVPRNAVIGKANRMGLSIPGQKNVVYRYTPGVPRVPEFRPEPIASKGKRFAALKKGQCQFFVGNNKRGVALFCGCATAPGSVYCAEHEALCVAGTAKDMSDLAKYFK